MAVEAGKRLQKEDPMERRLRQLRSRVDNAPRLVEMRNRAEAQEVLALVGAQEKEDLETDVLDELALSRVLFVLPGVSVVPGEWDDDVTIYLLDGSLEELEAPELTITIPRSGVGFPQELMIPRGVKEPKTIRTTVPLATDLENEQAAIRAAVASLASWGEVQTWAVRGQWGGETVTRLFRGPESALRLCFPDEVTRRRLRGAGVDVEDLGVAQRVRRWS